jgi:hypothetical protein
MESLENDPEPSVMAEASCVVSKNMSIAALDEKLLPDTNVEVVGGPLEGEREIVAWPKLSPASHRIPMPIKPTCLLNLVTILASIMSLLF